MYISYQVETKDEERVEVEIDRFPEDFASDECEDENFWGAKMSPQKEWFAREAYAVFTEQGIAMLHSLKAM